MVNRLDHPCSGCLLLLTHADREGETHPVEEGATLVRAAEKFPKPTKKKYLALSLVRSELKDEGGFFVDQIINNVLRDWLPNWLGLLWMLHDLNRIESFEKHLHWKNPEHFGGPTLFAQSQSSGQSIDRHVAVLQGLCNPFNADSR